MFSLPLVLHGLEVCASRDSILGKVLTFSCPLGGVRLCQAVFSDGGQEKKWAYKQYRKSFVRHHQRTEVWRVEGDYDKIGHARGFWGAGYNLFHNLDVV